MNQPNFYQPTKLPLEPFRSNLLKKKLIKAKALIKKFNEMMKKVEDPEKVFFLLSAREIVSCLQSPHDPLSALEFLEKKALGFAPQKKDRDLFRVFDYSVALKKIKKLKNRKITTGFLCNVHSHFEAGYHKNDERGALRKKINWIGPEGGKRDEALYFPPHPSQLLPFMKNLNEYYKIEEKEPLLQIAIYFAQFLLIHPFMDGNGRVGRSLLPIMFYQKGVTKTLLLYMSPYFHRNRKNYSYFLYKISSEEDWTTWILFFLEGLIQETTHSIKWAQKILKAYRGMLKEVKEIPGSRKVVDELFAKGILPQEEITKKGLKVVEELVRKKWVFVDKRKMVSVKPLLTILRLEKA